MRLLIAFLALLWIQTAQAKVEVLFHPHDPCLETAAQWLQEAHATIDIAMYSMDTTANSPVIQALQSPEIQKRLQSRELIIRMILQLYGEPDDNDRKRQAMEDLGIDVRIIGRSTQIHHKFAVIDGYSPFDRVISGSANWSVTSARDYNENTLFFTHEPEATARYRQEFERLWQASKEFGRVVEYPPVHVETSADQADLEIYFNSPRFLDKDSDEPSNLTKQIVRLIDEAQSSLQIATTRIRLIPVLEAVRRAADRGVSIQLILGEDDFHDLAKRGKYLFNHDKIALRVKFYNLDMGQFLRFQMHNKFIIVDGVRVATGSFNWSPNSESHYFENLAVLSGGMALEVLPNYRQEFAMLWDLGRDQYDDLLASLQNGTHQGCAIPQMVLSPTEIYKLLKYTSCQKGLIISERLFRRFPKCGS